jgi:hypothetical protein
VGAASGVDTQWVLLRSADQAPAVGGSVPMGVGEPVLAMAMAASKRIRNGGGRRLSTVAPEVQL